MIAVAAAIVLLVVARVVGAGRVRTRDADRRSFSLAVIACLVASPIVWPHYLALLFVPVALLSPRLSPAWFVPLLAYLAPVAQTTEHPWQMLPYFAVMLIVLGAVARRSPRFGPSDTAGTMRTYVR